MEKTILVTGQDTFLGNEILKTLSSEGHRIASTVNPRKDLESHWEKKDAHYVLPWNRRSSLGARNLLLEVRTKLGALDEAWVVFAPETDSRNPGEIPASEMEEKIDQGIKGFFHLVRELDVWGRTNPEFSLNFVLFHELSSGLGPLSATLYSGFQGMARALVQTVREYKVRGFESAGHPWEGFLEFLRDQKSKAPYGRWHGWVEKKGIFVRDKGGLS